MTNTTLVKNIKKMTDNITQNFLILKHTQIMAGSTKVLSDLSLSRNTFTIGGRLLT